MAKVRHEPLISYARRADGSVAAIDEVPRGAACQCTCFACKQLLIARHGQIRQWSFAHQSNSATACDWAAETALHYAMKDVIAQEGRIFVPQLDISVERTTSYGEPVRRSITIPGQLVALDSVALEFSVHPVRPDVVAVSGGRRIFIEVIVTHGVDEKKLKHIKKLGASAIKIDLRGHERTVDREMLQRLLLSPAPEKGWIFHRKAEAYEAALLEEVKREIEEKELRHSEQLAEKIRKARTQEPQQVPLGRVIPPMPIGVVMCFRLASGGEAYIKRDPQGALVLEYTQAADVNVVSLSALRAVQTAAPTLWNVSDKALVGIIPYLNSCSVSTTNRTPQEYMMHRFGA